MARVIGEGQGPAGDSLREAVRTGASGLVVVDVRSPGEFAAAHIPGSYNLPLDALPEVASQLSDLRNETVALVCRTGIRAGQAETILKSAGLESARVLAGGIEGWEQAGLPLDRGRGAWSVERQVRAIAGGLVLTGVVGSLTRQPEAAVALRLRGGRPAVRGPDGLLRDGEAPDVAPLQPRQPRERRRRNQPPALRPGAALAPRTRTGR